MVISVISLIGLFSGIASYLITLALIFIGSSCVILFGHVSILCTFLFILILIDIRISELENRGDDGIYFYLGKGIILSKIKTDIGKRLYSSKSIAKELNPNFVTGFSDGEGCLHVSIRKNNRIKLGWRVESRFQIGLHVKDKDILQEIQSYFGVGSINWTHGPNTIQLRVQSFQDIESVINHFDKFPLLTKKRADFDLLKKVFILMKRKEHLTPEGLRKIVALKAAMNLGLSEKLKLAFPDVVTAERPDVQLPQTIDPNWLAGFTSGEGSFMVKITAIQTHPVGFQVILVYQLPQHKRDSELMKMFIIYLECGYVIKDRDSYCFRVTKYDDIINKIIPFFQKYPILGVKALDFEDWCRVAELMKEKKHLTKEGLELIKKIKERMNIRRILS